MDILLETVSPFKPFIIEICSNKEKKNREGKEREREQDSFAG